MKLRPRVPAVVRTVRPKHIDWKEATRHLGRHVKYYRGIYKDKRTPLRAKLLLGAALAYFFSPFDLIPDFIPVAGQLDDAVIVPFLFGLANRAVPDDVKDHYRVKFLDVEGETKPAAFEPDAPA